MGLIGLFCSSTSFYVYIYIYITYSSVLQISSLLLFATKGTFFQGYVFFLIGLLVVLLCRDECNKIQLNGEKRLVIDK